MSRALFLVNLFFITVFISSQQPSNIFGVLNFNNSARSTALGGYVVAVTDGDASTAIQLPSNIEADNCGQLVLNYVNYFADSDYGSINYTFNSKKIGLLSASIIYCNYGTFNYSDPSGVFDGNNFSVNDLVAQIGHSKILTEKLNIGINLKLLSSFYEQYSSFGIGSDIGLTYFDKDSQFGCAILCQNIGRSVKDYHLSNLKENLPFNIQFSLNKKLTHAPLRFHLIYHDVQEWQIGLNNSLSASRNRISQFSYDFFNHIVLANEFLFSENFHFRFGYGFQNRRDLQPTSRPGTTGISWGVGFKVKNLKINYSNSKFHFAGTANNISIIKDLK